MMRGADHTRRRQIPTELVNDVEPSTRQQLFDFRHDPWVVIAHLERVVRLTDTGQTTYVDAILAGVLPVRAVRTDPGPFDRQHLNLVPLR
jgi:hypothetical protein